MATVTTLHDSNNYLIGFGHQIEILEREEAPLLKLGGVGAGNLKKLGMVRDWPSTTLKWVDYPLAPITSVLTGSPGTSTTVSVDTGHGVRFRKGDVLLNETTLEKYLVQSVSTDALTVERGYGVTSNTSASATQVVRKIGRAMPEGYTTYETGYVGATVWPYNYTQIISQAVSVSRTERKQSNLSIQDQLDFQTQRLINDGGTAGELPKALVNTFYHGERIIRSTTGATVASTNGSMGGFDTFVSGAPLVEANLGRSLQKPDVTQKLRTIRELGGKATHLICDYEMLEVINDLFPAEDRLPASTTGGDAALTTVRTVHGNLTLVPDYLAPSGTVYLTNPKYWGWLPFDEFFYKEYKEVGDNYVQDIVGEYTFFLRHGDTSHAKIAGIAT